MELEVDIDPKLWRAVENAYRSQDYCRAILAAIMFTMELMRERAGLDADGSQLIGLALGGENPRLKLNKFETDTEKNFQKGFEQILRGIYIGLRNPRSHSPHCDTRDDAEKIIFFIDYIVKFLAVSQSSFSIEKFVGHIKDKDLPGSLRYAELTVTDIPRLRLGDAARTIFEKRTELDLKKLKNLILSIINKLDAQQLNIYLSLVSDELRVATSDRSIGTALQCIKPDLWCKISEIAALRIENRIIQDLRLGKIDDRGNVVGSLAPVAQTFMKFFHSKKELVDSIELKFIFPSPGESHYIARYILKTLPQIVEKKKDVFINYISSSILGGDENLRRGLITHIKSWPSDWQLETAKRLESITDIARPALLLEGGTPFLSDKRGSADDDLPF